MFFDLETAIILEPKSILTKAGRRNVFGTLENKFNVWKNGMRPIKSRSTPGPIAQVAEQVRPLVESQYRCSPQDHHFEVLYHQCYPFET